jgi:hypothetical protein
MAELNLDTDVVLRAHGKATSSYRSILSRECNPRQARIRLSAYECLRACMRSSLSAGTAVHLTCVASMHCCHDSSCLFVQTENKKLGLQTSTSGGTAVTLKFAYELLVNDDGKQGCSICMINDTSTKLALEKIPTLSSTDRQQIQGIHLQSSRRNGVPARADSSGTAQIPLTTTKNGQGQRWKG